MTRRLPAYLTAAALAAAPGTASSQAPAEARAAAVKTALVSQSGVDGSRITTKGFGDTEPAVPDATAEGRARNHRVGLVKP